MPQLEDLARAHGIQTSYVTMAGECMRARPETLRAVLEGLDVPARSGRQIRESLRRLEQERARRVVEPVLVAWDRKPFTVDLQLRNAAARCRLRLEDGTQRDIALGKHPGGTWPLQLPGLPFGYHHLEIAAGRQQVRSLILSAPTKSFSKRAMREWGLFLPMYAARSRSNWGTGNLSDWRHLCEWIATRGGSFAGTLPLLGAFLDYPACDPSPYSPATRLFWNEFYLDLERLPEFQLSAAARKRFHSPSFQNQLRRFRNNTLVDYKAEWRLRRSLLEILSRAFFESSPPERTAFETYLAQRPEVRDYAAFRAVCDRARAAWHAWPDRLRKGTIQTGDFDEATRDFHLYIQWRTQCQVDDLIHHCGKTGVQLYLDLPLGVHPDGFDVWRDQNDFALDVNVGAPPDAFFTLGQNWGFSPLHPARLRENGYRAVLGQLRFQMRHTGMLRLDHVMSLHRLYCIPRGFPPTDGVYMGYRSEEFHAILSLESHRHRTLLVGENLGTVPPEVNDSMRRHGMRSMYVAQYQQRADPESALDLPDPSSLASLNTHDIPTFPGHWLGVEILDHVKLGLVPKSQLLEKRAARRRLNAALVNFLKAKGVLGKASGSKVRPVVEALLVWLARSPAEMVLVNLEDLLLETQPQNVPGTYMERPNWRRKARRTLEQIFRDQRIAAALKAVAKNRKR